MITISVLEKADVLLPTDWIRPIMAQCEDDEVNTFNTYSGRPMNHLKLVPASDIIGERWFNPPNTIRTIDKKFKDIGGFAYEVVRGKIPKSHQLHWKKS